MSNRTNNKRKAAVGSATKTDSQSASSAAKAAGKLTAKTPSVLFAEFCAVRNADRHELYYHLFQLQNAVRPPLSAELPAPALATDSKATDSKATDSKATDSKATDSKATDSKATDSKAIRPKSGAITAADNARNAVLYDLYFRRMTSVAYIVEQDDATISQSDWLKSAQQLNPISDADIQRLQDELENELSFIRTENAIRTLAKGLSTGAARSALRLQRSVIRMLGEFDAQYEPPSADNDGSDCDADSTVESEANQKFIQTDICVGCAEKKICSKINAWLRPAGRSTYLEFDFAVGTLGFGLKRGKYLEAGEDWLCCHCGVAVLYCLARRELVDGLKNEVFIDCQSETVGNMDCGCKDCGDADAPQNITEAYESRILKKMPNAEADDHPVAAAKKSKTDPADGKAAAAAAAAKPKATKAAGSAAAAASDEDL